MAGARAAAAGLLIAVLVLFGTAPAWAVPGERFALVIGNSNYDHVEPLPNTGRDAEAMAEALDTLGFTVFKGIDLTGEEFESLVDAFDVASAKADTVVFYYAGHGFQLNGLNHLAPVDAVLKDRASIDAETLKLDDVVKRIHRRQRQTIVFLDACRNNPLPPSAQKAAERGLAQVGTGDGTFIAFATQPGNVSYDGTSKNSPFTEALLTHIGKPGKSISSLMIEVRNDVSDRTLGRQVPWDQSSLRADFFFNPSPDYVALNAPTAGGIVIGRNQESAIRGNDAKETAAQPQPSSPLSIGPAPVQIPLAEATTAPAQPETVTAAVASRAEPAGTVAAAAAGRAVPDTVTAATTARAQAPTVTTATTARAQADTMTARAEAETLTAAATALVQSDAFTETATVAAVGRLKPDREWFPEDEQASSGEGAGAAELPASEERRMAALDPQQSTAPEAEEPPEALIDRQELARSIQSGLARLGCYRLSVDGVWGPGSRTSLERFYREKGETPSSLEPSTDLLAALQEESGTVCAPPATPKKAKKPAVAAPERKKAPTVRRAQKQPQRAPALAAPPSQPTAKSPKILGF